MNAGEKVAADLTIILDEAKKHGTLPWLKTVAIYFNEEELRAIVSALSRLSGNGGEAATPSAALEEEVAEAMIRAVTAPAEAGDDAVRHAREDDGDLWHFARVQARAAISVLQAERSEGGSPTNLEPQCGVGEDMMKKAFKSGQRNVIGLLVTDRELANHLPVTVVDRILDAFWTSAAPVILQGASAAPPTPIDDGAVERETLRSELAAQDDFILKFTDPNRNGDWACAQCKPNSEIIKKGFVCGYHRAEARSALQAAQTKT